MGTVYKPPERRTVIYSHVGHNAVGSVESSSYFEEVSYVLDEYDFRYHTGFVCARRGYTPIMAFGMTKSSNVRTTWSDEMWAVPTAGEYNARTRDDEDGGRRWSSKVATCGLQCTKGATDKKI